MLFTIFFTALKNKEEEVDPFYRRLWEENINPRKKKIKKKVAGLTCTLFSTKVKSRLHLHSKYVYLRLFEAPWHYDPRGSEAQVQLGGFTGEEDRENTGKINEKKTFPDIPVQLVQRGPRH